MLYEIHFITDDELPAAHDWAVAHYAGKPRVFLKASRLNPVTLEECWLAVLHLCLDPAMATTA